MNIYEYIVDRRMNGNAYVLDELVTFLNPCRKPEKVNPKLDVWCDIHGVEINDLQRKTIIEYLLGSQLNYHYNHYWYSSKTMELPFDMVETLLYVEWKYI